jgi:beta-glucosidase/6-phospho-beta-glucosidase/beta-galactosidase
MVMSYFTPHNRWNPLDVALNYAVKRVTNHRFLKRVSHKLDFLGVNHYFTFHTHWTSVSSFTNIRHPGMGLRTNDMGWNMEPIGLYHVLMEASRYGLPLLVTENGLADAKDTQREWYIKEYLASVYKAVDDGAPVIGYLHWSLIDNFEWADGYAPRFGLAAVNFETFKRTIRPSAKTYAKIAKLNALDKG